MGQATARVTHERERGMSAELQVFAGHVLVVGGRAVRVPPPGALTETAPKRVARAREGDTFFILVTPAGETHAQAAFFTELAELGADVYFGSSGAITSGLREALTAIHQHLVEEPTSTGEARQVNALALVLRGEELYAARSGRTFGVLCQGTDLISFPTFRRDPLEINLPPLGVGPEPEIQLARFTIAPGQVMLLADSGLLDASDDALRGALTGDSMRVIVGQIKAIAGPQTAASAIRFATPETHDPDGIIPQASSRPPRTAPLRPPKPAGVPATPVPAASTPTPPEVAAVEPPAHTEAVPVLEPMPSPEAGRIPPFAPEEPPDQGLVPPGDTAPFVLDEPATVPLDEDLTAQAFAEEAASPAPGRLSGMAGRLRRTPGGAPSPFQKARLAVQRTSRDALRLVLTGLLNTTDFLTRALDQILPQPREGGKQGIPTNMAIGLAVLIPVVIVIVVLGLVLSGYDKSEFETYLERAKTAHQEALRLSGGNCENQALRPMWVEVLRLGELAAKYRPNDPDVLVIDADAQNYLDCYDDVVRRDLVLLHEFPADSDLVGPIVHDGVDLYTLDRKTGAVYHDTLNETGTGLTSQDDTPIVQRGQLVGQYTIGDLFDIDWLRSGGTVHDNVLLALDRRGVLVGYSPTFFATAQQLVIEGRWQNPIAMAVFRSNLYVLDTGANQIWRYVPPAGERRYSAAPEEYFNGDELPDLKDAVDFGISDEGAVYVLFRDGTVRRYRRNIQGYVEEQPFEYRQRPPGAITSGVALFVDNDPASLQLYILDTANATIYETLLAGTYQKGYRPRNLPDAFHDLRGFYADAVVRNNMYVIAGNRIYVFRRDQ
jgi:hypothetical protein